MVDRVLIDTLNFKARSLAIRWKDLIRKAPQLKHYNELSNEDLYAMNEPMYRQLARSLERGIDKAVLGNFFVRLGKDRMQKGFPISETVFAVNLSQQMIVDYMISEFVLDNPVALYQTLGAVNKVNEFFFLGCFYMIKGFLEETYKHMNKKDNVSETLLKTYFKDDFFFKKDIDE
jgi:hypothetical protein